VDTSRNLTETREKRGSRDAPNQAVPLMGVFCYSCFSSLSGILDLPIYFSLSPLSIHLPPAHSVSINYVVFDQLNRCLIFRYACLAS